MEKSGNIKEGKTPCVKCGSASTVIRNGDPLCWDCAAPGTKSASVDKCSGSCKTVDELTDKHKD